jgi:hypothetical protein
MGPRVVKERYEVNKFVSSASMVNYFPFIRGKFAVVYTRHYRNQARFQMKRIPRVVFWDITPLSPLKFNAAKDDFHAEYTALYPRR